MKYVPPSITETAFNCPHCDVLANQFWFNLHAGLLKKGKTPVRIDEEGIKKLDLESIEDPEKRANTAKQAARMAKGRPFIEENIDAHRVSHLRNINMSRCFNCDDVAFWVDDRLMWPRRGGTQIPNPDLPDDVRGDYDEASAILDPSPRGAAALLRLAVQKLCGHLGEKGKHIDTDIAALVKKGLDVRVQQALDVVRVVGNNALHPGQIDMKDDRATAEKLFGLVNLIGEIMISQPKHVSEMFDGLPKGALEAIKKRDGS